MIPDAIRVSLPFAQWVILHAIALIIGFAAGYAIGTRDVANRNK
jgi:hypothetical protein